MSRAVLDGVTWTRLRDDCLGVANAFADMGDCAKRKSAARREKDGMILIDVRRERISTCLVEKVMAKRMLIWCCGRPDKDIILPSLICMSAMST